MAKENKTNLQETEFTEEQLNYVYENRRYVDRKETIGFIMWDAAQSFNINLYSGRFITNVVGVDLGLQAILGVINGVWDVVNDIFFGTIVDKTRTRWGKFRPYLLALAIPGFILTCLYWLMPLMFEGRSDVDMTKFIFYCLLTIIREGVGTFQGIARTGLMSTITPHPVDRTRLITLANFASGTFGEKLPEQITTVILDLIDNNKIGKTKTKASMYRTTFVGMGLFTTLVSSLMSFWFFFISKERVIQSIESPSVMDGVRSILNNKPMLLVTLSEFLGGFSIGGSKSDYYIDVLHFASMTMIAGIPAAPISPVSYSYVPWLRRKYSTRSLYIVAKYIDPILKTGVFLFGIIGMNWKTFGGISRGVKPMYQRIVPMGIAMAIWEVIWTLFLGLRTVITTEVYNECMDYCEWKNGYRTEGMTSVAKGLATKVATIGSGFISTVFKKLVNYDTSAYMEGREQPDKVKFYLFAMFTIVPSITGALGIIPLFFYDLTGKKKEAMYADLLARRAEVSTAVGSGDADALAKAAELQRIE